MVAISSTRRIVAVIFDAWNQAARSGTAYEVECRHHCADGTYRWFLVQGVPSTDAAGRVVEWFGTCTDIDEQKRAAAALAEATRAKDEFLAVLSHELRTPLTPVLMAVTALLDDRQSYPSLRPTLKMIRDNVRLEARLIDDLLDISRIARRQMEYRFEVVDVHTLIERAVEICQGQIESKGHHLTIELAAVEHHVRGDPARLQQVLWNLITNAAKYTPRADGSPSARSHTARASGRRGRRQWHRHPHPTTSRTCSMPSSGATGRQPSMRADWGWA